MILNKPERFYVARAALMLVTSIATFVVFCCLLYWARTRKDPARKFLSFIKFAAVFFLLYVLARRHNLPGGRVVNANLT